MDPQGAVTNQWMLVGKDGTYHLPKGMIFLGRQECDVILQSPSVDKRHAVIFFNSTDKQFHIKDLNSVSGTYVNGIRIPEQSYIKLNHSDSLRFGYGPDVFYIRKLFTSPVAISPKENFQADWSPNQHVPPQLPMAATKKEVVHPVHKALEIADEDQSCIHEADSLEDMRSAGKHSPSPQSVHPPRLLHPGGGPASTVHQSTKVTTSWNSVAKGRPADLKLNTSGMGFCGQSELPQVPEKYPSTVNTEEAQIPSTGDATPSQTIDREAKNDADDDGSLDPATAEKQASQVNSSQAAMAFTIPLDNNNVTMSRKKLSIRDSISKYAPPKPESERAGRQKSVKPSESISKKVTQETKGHSQPDRKKDGSPVDNQEELKESKSSEQSQNNQWKERLDNLARPNSNGSGKLSERATYLIRRMLNGDSSTKVSPTSSNSTFYLNEQPQSPPGNSCPARFHQKSANNSFAQDQNLKSPGSKDASPSSGEKEGPGDDKSETGTYTVEMEQTDPAVEEARRKIDEVFGISDSSKQGHQRKSSPLFDRAGRTDLGLPLHEENHSVSKIKTLTGIHQGCAEEMDNEGGSPWHRPVIPPTRPKRRLPTPPIERAVLETSGNGGSKTTGSATHWSSFTAQPVPTARKKGEGCSQPRHFGMQQSWHGETNGIELPGELTMKSSSVARVTDTSSKTRHKRNNSLTNGHVVDGSVSPLHLSVTPTEKSCGSDLNNGKVPVIGSPHAKTPQGSAWRKIPWTLSNSELELDHSKSDTASVISDVSTSTEPSSQSSHSGRGKDIGPQMRLNRAFALRRARLGIESDGPVVSKDSSKNDKRGSSKCPSPGSGPLSRQDGGRFSLRLPQSFTKSVSKGSGKIVEPRIPRLNSACGSSSKDGVCQNTKPSKPLHDGDTSSHQNKREMSALDSLVISAIYQLSGKLRVHSRCLLQKERDRLPANSDSRLMIEEMLPQMMEKRTDTSPEGNLTRELSSILKNLKGVEQCLDVLSSLMDASNVTGSQGQETRGKASLTAKPPGFFIVDV